MLYPETDGVKAITNMSGFDFRQARGYGATVGGTGRKYQMHSSCPERAFMIRLVRWWVPFWRLQ